ncbi:MAG: NFACT family protein [Clostridia bacterium]|nr:NFACT family protein [Clostridia bacterium]
MAFDGVVARCIKWELEGILPGGRVSRVFQPEKDEIILVIRNNSFNYRLLISANSGTSRIGITNVAKENPMDAPNFCMSLRKHLIGAELVSVDQVECDRILKLVFRARNEMGDEVTKTLVCEIMGRYSNIILLNDKNVIIDCIKRVDERTSSFREVMPARVYKLPPPQNRILPQAEDALDVFKTAFADTESGSVCSLLLKSFSGFSKRLCEGITRSAGIDPSEDICSVKAKEQLCEALFSSLGDILEMIRNNKYSPVILTGYSGDYNDFHVLDVCAEERFIPYSTACACIDDFFKGKDEALHRKNATAELTKAVKNAFERTERKLKGCEEDLKASENFEDYKIKGELLAANLYSLSGGESVIKVINYYDEAVPEITIDLDPRLNPAANLRNYFRQYKKLKGKKENAVKGIEAAEKELQYLATVRFSLDNVSGAESLSEIREELIGGGYYKPRKEQGKKRPPSVKKNNFEELTAKDGTVIWAGKNNIQNDLITTKLAAPNDIWFHVKNYPGAHVILRTSLNGGSFTAAQLYGAAELAAKRSGFTGGSCEVDYTRVKHVKKISGAKPGMVNYTDFKTIVVKLDGNKT